MIMTQQQEQEISELVVACETYWLLRGISASTREEMKLELTQHLEDAIIDGKSIESVVGTNPHTFAESWAREMHVHVLTGDLLPRLVSSMLTSIAGLAVIEHLINRSLSFPLTFGIVTTVLILTLASFFRPLSAFLTPWISSSWKRNLLIGGAESVLFLSVTLITNAFRVNWDTVLFMWNWLVTVLLIIALLGYSTLKERILNKRKHRRYE